MAGFGMIHELATIEKQVRKQANEARNAAHIAHQLLDGMLGGDTLSHDDLRTLRKLMLEVKQAMGELTGDA